MSTVVAVQKNGIVAMAANNGLNFRDERHTTIDVDVQRLVRVGTAWVGYSGSTVWGNVLREYVDRREVEALHDESTIFNFGIAIWRFAHDELHFVNNFASGKDQAYVDVDTRLLVICPKGIFLVESDLAVTRFRRYCAIGSGTNYALGAAAALYDAEEPVTLARRACETSAELDLYSTGDARVVWMELKPET